jgi:hypothetical protein
VPATTLLRTPNIRVLASLVHTLGLMDRLGEALERFGELHQEAEAGRVPPLNLAIAHLGLGQRDEALTNSSAPAPAAPSRSISSGSIRSSGRCATRAACRRFFER